MQLISELYKDKPDVFECDVRLTSEDEFYLTLADGDYTKVNELKKYDLIQLYKRYIHLRAADLNKLYSSIFSLKHIIKREEEIRSGG
jgi:hypothetical protein